jgi:hypothetical protein
MNVPLKPKTYYSKTAGLCIAVNHGKLVPMDGEMKRAGEKEAQFTPIGNLPGLPHGQNWGSYSTRDEEIAAFLDARCVEVGDILDQAAFNRLLVPAEQRESESQREIQRLNNLVDVLQKQGKIPAQASK